VADLVPNIAKGRVAYYASLPATNDALIAVPIQTTWLPTDEQIRDADTLAAIVALGAQENTTMTRKTLTGVTVTTDDTANETRVTSANPSWTAGQMALAGGAVSRLIICYDPDTTGGTDADLIPLVSLDMVVTPDGNAFEFQFGGTGWYAAT
jgi:hypothetical protein